MGTCQSTDAIRVCIVRDQQFADRNEPIYNVKIQLRSRVTNDCEQVFAQRFWIVDNIDVFYMYVCDALKNSFVQRTDYGEMHFEGAPGDILKVISNQYSPPPIPK